MKIMIDANILFSAFYGGKVVKPAVDYINNNYQLFLPVYAIDEFTNSIEEKHPKLLDKLADFLGNLDYTPVETSEELLDDFGMRDRNDVPILQAAVDSDVDILITGDKDFDDVILEKPKIMTIAKFSSKYIKGA